MKNLTDYINESILDGTLDKKTDKMIKDEIKLFLKQHYKGATACKISKQPNSDGKYEVYVPKNIEFKGGSESLTNDLFVFTKVDGDFICDYSAITSLEGAPKEVGGSFKCTASKITSLKGAPEIVGGNFNCIQCHHLASLEGAPKEVGGSFNCFGCKKLTTLIGAPETVWGNFNCNYCDSLISLEGSPEYVDGDFECLKCSKLKSLRYAPKNSLIGGELKSDL